MIIVTYIYGGIKMEFSQARINYKHDYGDKDILPKSFCTVDGKFIENIKIKDIHGKPNEEFYKWEFIYSMIQSGRIPSRDYIGAEIYFPKGNIHSDPIKIDSVVFLIFPGLIITVNIEIILKMWILCRK